MLNYSMHAYNLCAHRRGGVHRTLSPWRSMPPKQKPAHERKHARQLAKEYGVEEKVADEACQLCPWPLNPQKAGEEPSAEYQRAVDYLTEFFFDDEAGRDQKRAQQAEKQRPNLGPGTRKAQSAGGATMPERPQAKRVKREVEELLGNDGMGPRSSMALVRQGNGLPIANCHTNAPARAGGAEAKPEEAEEVSLPSSSAAATAPQRTLPDQLSKNEKEYIGKIEKYVGKLLDQKCVPLAPLPTAHLPPIATTLTICPCAAQPMPGPRHPWPGQAHHREVIG